MAGTQAGGRKAAATNKERYGEDYYEKAGRKGGKLSRGGGFKKGSEFAQEMGRIGGKMSRKPKPFRQAEEFEFPEEDLV